MKRNLSAFTLIELLVVIAIIAILAAILFPVFAQAKLAAKKTTDLSNEKQYGLSMIMYQSDFDDSYPLAIPGNLGTSLFTMPADRTPTSNPSLRQSFYGNSIQPYIKNWGLYKSPAGNFDWTPFGAPNPPAPVSTNYVENNYLNGWNESQSPVPAHTVLSWNPWGNWDIPGYGASYPLIYAAGLGGFLTGQFSTPWTFSTSAPNCPTSIGYFTGTWFAAGDIKYNTWGGGDNVTYEDGHAKLVHFGSADYPFILGSDGSISQYWVNGNDCQNGCCYDYTLNPMISQ